MNYGAERHIFEQAVHFCLASLIGDRMSFDSKINEFDGICRYLVLSDAYLIADRARRRSGTDTYVETCVTTRADQVSGSGSGKV